MMSQIALPTAESFALFVIIILASIVIWMPFG